MSDVVVQVLDRDSGEVRSSTSELATTVKAISVGDQALRLVLDRASLTIDPLPGGRFLVEYRYPTRGLWAACDMKRDAAHAPVELVIRGEPRRVKAAWFVSEHAVRCAVEDFFDGATMSGQLAWSVVKQPDEL